MSKNQKSTPLEKRVKRRVTARNHTFFIITSPGLEAICLSETQKLFPDLEITPVDGGIEFKGTVRDCYKANLHLRTASRVLMRIGSLTANSFSLLEKKLTDFPWELYLSSDRNIDVNVTAKKSKLIHSAAIAERFKKNIHERLKGISSSDKKQSLFIRVFNDRFVISIDSSGDLLYKRGIKTGGGQAPVRETIAASALLLAGYDGRRPLIDPMCGSGTFSIEAAMIQKNIPAGWYRYFAFSSWPCFREGAYKDLRRHAETEMLSLKEKNIFASDIDDLTCRAFTETIEKENLVNQIQVTESDFFNIQPDRLTSQKGIVALNPPYGLRLGNSKESEEMVLQVFKKFEKDYKGWRIAIISPFTSFMNSSKLKLKRHPLAHGGLNLSLVVGK